MFLMSQPFCQLYISISVLVASLMAFGNVVLPRSLVLNPNRLRFVMLVRIFGL